MVLQKENDNFPAIESKDVENCNLTEKESKIAVMKKLRELQKQTLRNAIQ